MSRRATDFDVSSRIAVRLLAICLLGLLLHYLSLVMIPMVIAILICLLQFPMLEWLRKKRIPVIVAIMTTELFVFGPLIAMGYLLITSISPLVQKLPLYQDRLLQTASDGLTEFLALFGKDGGQSNLRQEVIDNLLAGVLQEGVNLAESSVGALTTTVGALSLTIIFSVFILIEATRWREKFSSAFGDEHPLLVSMSSIGHQVRRYVWAKGSLSGLTGLLVWMVLSALDVEFAFLWGLIALPLNFIPTVGAVIASIPPILVAIVDPSLGWLDVGAVALSLTVVNGVIGTLLDPKYVGNTLKLSPLVVLLSMIVWGLMWGPVGMLLGVPIMVAIKLVLAESDEFRSFAELMSA